MASAISTGFETWEPPTEPDPEMVKLIQRVLTNESKRNLESIRRAAAKRTELRRKLQETK